MEPIRLQKWLAQCGYGARRACELLIQAGRVRVNGQIATLGTKVDPARDRITVDGNPVQPPSAKVYLMLNKPAGYVTTRRDPHAPRTVMQLLKDVSVSVFPVGRLDAESEGLLLFTNDGALAHRLIHPRYKVPKTYRVWVKGKPSESVLKTLREGVMLEDGKTAPAKVRLIRSTSNTSLLEITLREGRKRQIRRMAQAVGHPVVRLVRIGFGPLRLPNDLAPGIWRYLTPEEVEQLRQAVGETDSPKNPELPPNTNLG